MGMMARVAVIDVDVNAGINVGIEVNFTIYDGEDNGNGN